MTEKHSDEVRFAEVKQAYKVVFVYQLRRKPYTSKCVYVDNDSCATNKRYRHVATIDPASWIEFLLNSKDKAKHIEELYD